MDELDQLVNSLNDSDVQWWPFVFLRPAPQQRLGNARVALLALLYGLFVGTLGNLLLVLLGKQFNPLALPLIATVGCFVLYRFTFAYFWNRRTARLACRPGRGPWSGRR